MLTKGASRLLHLLAMSGLLVACQTAPPQPAPATTAQPDENKLEQTAQTPTSTPTTGIPTPRPATDILFEQAENNAREGDHAEAIEQFQKLLELQADYPGAHTRLGLLLLNLGKDDDAYSLFSKAVEIDNRDAIAHNHLAVLKRRQGQFNSALQHYLKSLEANPDYAKAHLNLGILYDIYLANLPEALEHYQRYLALTGNDNEDVKKWIIDLERRIATQ